MQTMKNQRFLSLHSEKRMQILKKTNGYRKAISLGPKKVIAILNKKNITGRGGGSYPTGKKWEMVLKEKSSEKYVICNADEGEPGTFKDKLILTKNPTAVIEGILIASFVVGAKKAFIYLRGEYDYLKKPLEKKIIEILKKTKSQTSIEIVLGAGAYICGEETAIMESIEGKRGHPKIKPPYPTTSGLNGKPTVLNNVETLANVALALTYDDYDSKLHLYSLSGNVTKPGIYELPEGTSSCKLIEMGKPKNKIKAIYFGAFGGCMNHCDIPLNNEAISGKECHLGAHTIIAIDEKQSIVELAVNIAKFFEFESCGKCTPCREGTMRILGLLENISMRKSCKKDLETLQELAEVIKETSFCGLGKTATTHVLNALKYFRPEFEARCK